MLAPKVGCALKCVLWAADSTPKQHPKASCCLWAMGLEMAFPVAIAADDQFVKFIKNVQKKCSRPMNVPKTICCNHMQPHACASGHPKALKALLNFSTFDPDPDRTPQILPPPWAPWVPCMFGPLCWPPVAEIGWQTYTCLGLLLACVGTVPCT